MAYLNRFEDFDHSSEKNESCMMDYQSERQELLNFNEINENQPIHFEYDADTEKQELSFGKDNSDKISTLLNEVETDRFGRYIKDGMISTPVEELDRIIAENSQNKERLQLIKEVIKESENGSPDEGQKVYSKGK